MPSPIGHALGGFAVGAVIAGPGSWRLATACAVAGALADVDFLLPIQHRGPTHSLGAVVLVFTSCAAILAWRAGGVERPRTVAVTRTAAAVALAYASHVLLDWLGADSSTPRGVMALWPIADAFYVSGLDVFSAVERRHWLPGFWTRTAAALVRELMILGPPAAISVLAGRRARSYRPREGAPPRA